MRSLSHLMFISGLALLTSCHKAVVPSPLLTDWPTIHIQCHDDEKFGDDNELNLAIYQTLLATGGNVILNFSGPACWMNKGSLEIPDFAQNTTFQGGTFILPSSLMTFPAERPGMISNGPRLSQEQD